MGKSYRKTPIIKNTTADSDKEGKKLTHRIVRAQVNATLNELAKHDIDDLINGEVEIEPFLEVEETSVILPSDGKHYLDSNRFDDDEMRKLMGK